MVCADDAKYSLGDLILHFQITFLKLQRFCHLFANDAHLATAEMDQQIQIFAHQMQKPHHRKKKELT